MGRKHAYATKADLERLALRMHKTGILYSEAIREFKKQFILVALRTAHWNQSRAAQALGMHRNTLVRTIRALDIDICALRNAERRPPQSAAVPQRKKIAG
ncbi:MAG TPA: helix-turn-helix domain-containing protein [Terriglobales bacterium]|nr:helix-turn-helix domain-containing protein [Terriglobales bacterium]